MVSEAEKIKHLYNRAGFGNQSKDWSNNRNWLTVKNAIFQLNIKYKKLETVSLAQVQEANEKMKSGISKEEVKDVKQLLKNDVFELKELWLNEMIQSDSQLQEKMALFWHGHFACRSANPFFDQQYLDIIRKHALGNFGTMLYEISKTPAMLQFLNNQQNKKNHPNENFAREVMELFTLGRGNYSEQDVKEAARAFTGWGFDMSGQFKFRSQLHDYGAKFFMGKSGNFSGEDILSMLLEKKECAYFITKKIYQFFVNDIANENRVQNLADQFYQSGYDIKSLMNSIFSSDWFYDEENIGVKIKSPIELIVGMFRTIPAEFENPKSLVFIQRLLGQVLLNPPNVAGWSGDRSWIDSSSLLFRMRLPQVIYFDKDIDFSPKDELPEMNMQKMKMTDAFIKKMAYDKINAKTDWTTVLSYFSNSTNIVEDVMNMMLSKKNNAIASKLIDSNSDKSSKINTIKSVMVETMSLPDYQLC